MATYSFPYVLSTDPELNESAHQAASQRVRDARTFLDREFGPGFAVANPAQILACANLLAVENDRLAGERAIQTLSLLMHDLLKPIRDQWG